MKLYALVLVTLFLLGYVSADLTADEKDTTWHVGLARVDVTPTDSLWLAGYAARDHGATGTLHPLWVKAMVVQDKNGHAGVIITSDLLGFPKHMSETIKRRCAEKYQLSNAHIILSSSHTHTGPVLDHSLYDVYECSQKDFDNIEQYSRELEDKIVDVVGDAFAHIQPVHLYSTNGVVRFQVNRRNNDAATLATQSDLHGPNDYAVPVLQARTAEDEVTALLFGYACHPTVLSSYEWSGDYPGFAQIELENRFPGTAMFFQGCGADQNPLPRRTVGLAQQYGEELAAAVANAVTEKSAPLTAELEMACDVIDLAMTGFPSQESLEKMAGAESNYQQRWATRMLKNMETGEPLQTSYPYPIQVWRLGEQALFVLGGEVVIDYAIQLKRIFGEHTFVMAYANDVMGYIPSVRVLREGGYEGVTSQIVYGLPGAWSADIENRIISTCINLARTVGIRMPESVLVSE